MKLTETTVKETVLYRGRIVTLRCDDVTLPDGKPAKREVVEHIGGVGVLPLTDDGNVLLVRQFRYPYKEELLEIPAGKRDSKDEEPLETGKRELKEETGASADRYTYLGKVYPSPGYTGEVIHIYLAEGLTYGETCPDEDEFLNLERIPFEKALAMVYDGTLTDSKTQIALMKAAKILADRA